MLVDHKLLYYVQTNAICLIILGLVYAVLRSKRNMVTARRLAFVKLLWATSLICVSDVMAWWSTGQTFKGADIFVQISNILYFASITWAGYAWLNYVYLRIRNLEYNRTSRKWIRSVPMIAMMILLVTNPFTGFMFTVDGNNAYQRGNGVIVHWIISWGYMLFATLLVFLKIRKTHSRLERSALYPMFGFIIAPALAALLQMFVYGTTTTQCGITVSVLLIAVSYLNEEVSTDTLTGLNNRRALEVQISEDLKHTAPEYTVMMCDVDSFKAINDTLGHTAGDLVLKRMAETLRRVCDEAKKKVFLCRYGGDEFVILGTDMKAEDSDELVRTINEEIEKINMKESDRLKFGISIGTASGICSEIDDVDRLIGMADGIMYQNKKAKRLQANT